MADPYDPRAAALAHAYAAACAANMDRGERVVWEDEAIQAIAAGLVYVGEQIGRLVSDAPVASKRVKVVALTARTALLEVDGRQHQLFAGESIEVPGLEVTVKGGGDVGAGE